MPLDETDAVVRGAVRSLCHLSALNEQCCSATRRAPSVSIFHGTPASSTSIEATVLALFRGLRCHASELISALVYLDRVGERVLLNRCTVLRTFLAALLLACKFLRDPVTMVSSFARVARIASADLAQLEVTLLAELRSSLLIDLELYETYRAAIRNAGAARSNAGERPGVLPADGDDDSNKLARVPFADVVEYPSERECRPNRRDDDDDDAAARAAASAAAGAAAHPPGQPTSADSRADACSPTATIPYTSSPSTPTSSLTSAAPAPTASSSSSSMNSTSTPSTAPRSSFSNGPEPPSASFTPESPSPIASTQAVVQSPHLVSPLQRLSASSASASPAPSHSSASPARVAAVVAAFATPEQPTSAGLAHWADSMRGVPSRDASTTLTGVSTSSSFDSAARRRPSFSSSSVHPSREMTWATAAATAAAAAAATADTPGSRSSLERHADDLREALNRVLSGKGEPQPLAPSRRELSMSPLSVSPARRRPAHTRSTLSAHSSLELPYAASPPQLGPASLTPPVCDVISPARMRPTSSELDEPRKAAPRLSRSLDLGTTDARLNAAFAGYAPIAAAAAAAAAVAAAATAAAAVSTMSSTSTSPRGLLSSPSTVASG